MKIFSKIIFFSLFNILINCSLVFASSNDKTDEVNSNIVKIPRIEVDYNDLNQYLETCKEFRKQAKLLIGVSLDEIQQNNDKSFFKVSFLSENFKNLFSQEYANCWDVIYQDGHLQFSYLTKEAIKSLYNILKSDGQLILTNLPIFSSVDQNNAINIQHIGDGLSCTGSIAKFQMLTQGNHLKILAPLDNVNIFDRFFEFYISHFPHVRATYESLLNIPTNREDDITDIKIKTLSETPEYSVLYSFFYYLKDSPQERNEIFSIEEYNETKQFYENFVQNSLNLISSYGKTKKFLKDYFIKEEKFKELELYVNITHSETINAWFRGWRDLDLTAIQLPSSAGNSILRPWSVEFIENCEKLGSASIDLANYIDFSFSLEQFLESIDCINQPQLYTAHLEDDSEMDIKKINGFSHYFTEIRKFNTDFPIRLAEVKTPIYMILKK